MRLFRGGVFEDNLLDVSGMDAGAWESACAELEAAGIVTVEEDVLLAGRRYLRLPEAKAPAGGAVAAEVRARYVEVYRALMMAIRQAFHGPSPRRGMEIMAREEANYRRAVGWARDVGDRARASEMGDLFTRYLERAGRSEDRDRWVAWLAGESRYEVEEAAEPVEEAVAPIEEAVAPEPAAPVMEPEAAAREVVVEAAEESESEGERLAREGAAAIAEGQIARAAGLIQRALQWFQDRRDTAGMARACHLFGQLEDAAGRPEGARVWYERAEAMAKRGG